MRGSRQRTRQRTGQHTIQRTVQPLDRRLTRQRTRRRTRQRTIQRFHQRLTRKCTILLAAVTMLLAWAGRGAAQQRAEGDGGDARSESTLRDQLNADVFAPLELPTPNAYRTGAGEPGPRYWQQAVSYDIRVRLIPERHRIQGSATITYTNRSPSTLERIWLQLDQNRFDPGSRGARITPPGARFTGAFAGGGYEIESLTVERDGRATEPETLVDGTVMRVELSAPLPPGQSVELHVDFGFTIPAYGADRMGRLPAAQGTVYELAQWYPRVFTYDDVRGWNVLPYLGLGEFYLEYGSFDVRITVPRDFVVVATGQLQNPGEVLTAEQRSRLDRARESAGTVRVIAPEEVGDPATRPRGRGPLTWRYHAEDVRDFSWAASPAFIWDAASWEDVLLMSVYPREGLGTEGDPGWERSLKYMRHSISHYSRTWHRYPYPVAVNVAGRVGGMEYPMVVFCSVDARSHDLFGVTDHELGHQWFPMMVGSDERRHFWMDEGLNSFMNQYSETAFYGADASQEHEGRARMGWLADRMEAQPQPTLTRSDRILREWYGFLGYRKPAYGLRILRDYVLGPERFDPAFRAFIRRWKFRHPTPADFFRTVEDVTGEELDWFWRGWFGTTRVLDQAVTGVETRGDTTLIHLENEAGLVMPVEMEIEFADGRTERRRLPVEIWHSSDRFVESVVGQPVASVTLDPDAQLPDVERGDNVWLRPAAADEAAAGDAGPGRDGQATTLQR